MTDGNPRLTRRRVLQLATALALGGASQAFALRDISGRMMLDVQVNGAGPFSFLLATGAGRSAVARALVDKLGLGSGDVVTLSSVESGWLKLQNVQLGVTSSEDVGAADGLLGVEGMKRHKIEMDLQNGTVAIVPTNTQGRPRGFRVVTMRQLPNGVPLVPALVGKKPFEVIVDTGAIRTTGNRALQVALAGAATEAVPIQVAAVELGQPYLEYQEFSEEKPALRLGMDLLGFLSQVHFDFRRLEFQFKP